MGKAHRSKSRPFVRAVRTLFVLIAVSAALVGYHAWETARDVGLASGPATQAQLKFFEEAADRPDILPLFNGMDREQRLATARNIGKHRSAKLPKLAVTLLESFDEQARSALGQSLVALAEWDPAPVAEELSRGSSFQRDAVFRALKAAGPSAIAAIVRKLDSGPHRSNAVRLLVELGKASVPELLRALADEQPAARLAAAEAAGKLRARAAVPRLVALHQDAKDGDRLSYLTALAAIGDPGTTALLVRELESTDAPATVREQAALGLGRIASDEAAQKLVALWLRGEPSMRDAAIEALRLCGDAALRARAPATLRLEVAFGQVGPLADEVIRGVIVGRPENRSLYVSAIRGARGRPAAVRALREALAAADPSSDGDVLEAAVESLLSTPEGAAALVSIPDNSAIAGFVARARALGVPSG